MASAVASVARRVPTPAKRRLVADVADGPKEQTPDKAKRARTYDGVASASLLHQEKALAPISAVADGPSTSGRLRWAPEEPLRECLIGYIDDNGDDPVQAGICAPRQSREIQTLVTNSGREIPIAKDKRANYVWVAGFKGPKREPKENDAQQPLFKKYTWNAEDIEPLPQFRKEDDNTCDICGNKCKEVLYEFRCYFRTRAGTRAGAVRRLHPFVAYISKECGRGLLGVPSEASRFREMLYKMLQDSPDIVSTMREVLKTATLPQRRIIMEELRHFSRSEDGEADNVVELRKAEAQFGGLALRSTPEDMFRGAGRALAPALQARELASLTLKRHEEHHKTPKSGFFGKVAKCLHDRTALPYAQTPWPKEDVLACFRLFVKAWPIRVELLDSLSGTEILEPKHKAVLTLRFVYLPGCGELHVPEVQQVDPAAVSRLKDGTVTMLKSCREDYSPMASLVGRRGPVKAEDKAIDVPEGQITAKHTLNALQSITWPNCFSRNNVKPDGWTHIYAFPLGVVLNYCMGLVPSRATKLWPNLTTLLTKFIAQQHPDFAFSTIQLNKDYATKMHVDGNNHGPSYIIGLGDYEGGDIWIHEEDGDVEVEVPCTMRGWPALRAGQMARGRCVSCKDKWVKFDGNTPHATMPFTGTRLSLVYFTRKGWLSTRPEAKELLESMHFNFPGEEYLSLGSERTDEGEPVTKKPKVAVPSKVNDANAHEAEEVDEDEHVDIVMREELDSSNWQSRQWPTKLKETLGLDWDEACVDMPLVVSLCGSGAGALVFALQELLPDAALMRLLMLSDAQAAPLRFARRNCRPEYAFADLQAATKGGGHCEIHHAACETPADDEDIFFGSFSCTPFLNRTRPKQSCFDDPNSAPFLEIRKHLELRRPRVAILEVPDFEALEVKERAGVLGFVLDGREPQSGAAWGLRLLSDYGIDVVDTKLSSYGLPRVETRTYFVLIRQDAGGQLAAESATKLARVLAASFAAGTVQEMMFEEDDARFEEVRKNFWKKGAKAQLAEDCCKSKTSALKAFAAEAKELRLKPGDAPYSDLLRQELGDAAFAEWFPHASPNQATQLNLIYERVRQNGRDVEGLVADLGQALGARAWRDDGLMPLNSAPGLAGANAAPFGPHYSFARRRLLTGQEEMLCLGFPVWRLSFTGFTDSQALHLAAGASPVPTLGAVALAVLAVADLGSTRRLRADRAHMAQLLTAAPPATEGPAEKALTAAMAVGGAEAGQADADAAQFEGRAAALLNLISHGAFMEEERVEPEVVNNEREKLPDETRNLLSAISNLGGSGQENPIRPEARPPVIMDEPRDWSTRLRKFNVGIQQLPWKTAMNWIVEAADDPEAPLSSELVEAGLAYMDKQLRKGAVPMEVMQSRSAFVDTLKVAGHNEKAVVFDEAVRTKKFLERLAARDPILDVTAQTTETMPRYVSSTMRGCTRNGWPMRRALLEHIGQHAAETKDSLGAMARFRDFGLQGGWREIATWLADVPADTQSDWPAAVATLDGLSRAAIAEVNVEGIVGGELCAAMYQVVQQLGDEALKARVTARLEPVMVEVVAPCFTKKTTDKDRSKGALEAFAKLGGEMGKHFKQASDLITACQKTMKRLSEQAANGTVSDTEERRRVKAAFGDDVEKLTEQNGKPEGLVSMTNALITTVQRKLDESIAAAVEAEKKELVAQREANAKAKQEAAEAEGKKLLGMLQEGRLKKQNNEGLNELMASLTATRSKLAACPMRPASVVSAIAQGEKAASRYCALPALRSSARRWLRSIRLGHCAKALESHGILEQLLELAVPPGPEQVALERAKVAEIASATKLPRRCCAELVAAITAGKLTEKDLLPAPVPSHFERKLSRSVGLYYFQEKGAVGKEKSQWTVPTSAEPASWREPPEPPQVGEPQPHKAVYIGRGEAREVHCLLCSKEGWQHLASKEHTSRCASWRQLYEKLVELEGQVQAVQPKGDSLPGFAAAWVGEIRAALAAVQASSQVESLCWHRIVRPALPPALLKAVVARGAATGVGDCTPRELSEALAAMLVAMDAPEPNEEEERPAEVVVEEEEPEELPEPEAEAEEPQPEAEEDDGKVDMELLAQLPAPGVDLPLFPPPTVTAELTDKSPLLAYKALSPEALLGEGIYDRGNGDGKLWCGYCERDVESIAGHLKAAYLTGQLHAKNRQAAVTFAEQLREEGWRLQREGISLQQRRFKCQHCKMSGDWPKLWDHMASTSHEHARASQGPPAGLPEAPSKRELRTWQHLLPRSLLP